MDPRVWPSCQSNTLPLFWLCSSRPRSLRGSLRSPSQSPVPARVPDRPRLSVPVLVRRGLVVEEVSHLRLVHQGPSLRKRLKPHAAEKTHFLLSGRKISNVKWSQFTKGTPPKSPRQSRVSRKYLSGIFRGRTHGDRAPQKGSSENFPERRAPEESEGRTDPRQERGEGGNA